MSRNNSLFCLILSLLTLPKKSAFGKVTWTGKRRLLPQMTASLHLGRDECHLLRAAGRLPMAPAPERVSAPPDRLPLFPDLALCRRVGADTRHPAWGSARDFGPHAGAQRGDHR